MTPSFQTRLPKAVEINPTRFYKLAQIAKQLDAQTQSAIDIFIAQAEESAAKIDADVRALARANDRLDAEVRQFTRKNRNPFDPTTEEEANNQFGDIRHTISGNSFIGVIFNVMRGLQEAHKHVLRAARGVRPAPIVIVGKTVADIPTSMEELQLLSMQMEMNEGAITNFVNGVLTAEQAPNAIIDVGRGIVEVLDYYYAALLKRHSTEGVMVHRDPVTTDLAISIFENIDSNGEIQDGKDPNEVSAYSVRKAVTIIEALNSSLVGKFVQEPAQLIEVIQKNLRHLWVCAEALADIAKPVAEECRKVMGSTIPRAHLLSKDDFSRAVSFISDLDPTHIVYKEKTGLLSVEERKELEFRNQTLEGIASKLYCEETAEEIVQYVLRRKSELRKYHLEENSFFVCRIGSGNPFLGEAPGQLTVVPGIKPSVNLEEVVGSGFDEVKKFIGNVIGGTKWFDLFVATSPSKKADKSNVLLVGPQGCGKTEVLRAVASDRQSVGIFAQASDFLTCWKGEAEKNPKRLFEAGLKLQRESRKPVFFLIDEIDTVLNGDRGQMAFGGTNLATEFQVLMDGITTYPSLALWGATNHPERIPMPLIRRFAKVVIVGELSQDDRVQLLKQFMSFLPVAEDFPEQAWQDAAKKLDGAVGDVMRKATDNVWREKMGGFIARQPEEAEKLVNYLNDNGEKFSVSRFTAERRREFRNRLRQFVTVTPKDLHDSVDHLLSNVAIRGEIETAKDTYNNARAFLSEMNAR